MGAQGGQHSCVHITTPYHHFQHVLLFSTSSSDTEKALRAQREHFLAGRSKDLSVSMQSHCPWAVSSCRPLCIRLLWLICRTAGEEFPSLGRLSFSLSFRTSSKSHTLLPPCMFLHMKNKNQKGNELISVQSDAKLESETTSWHGMPSDLLYQLYCQSSDESSSPSAFTGFVHPDSLSLRHIFSLPY